MTDIDAALIRETRDGCPIARVVYADWLEDQSHAMLAQLVRDGVAHGPEAYDLLPRDIWRQISDHDRFVDRGYFGSRAPRNNLDRLMDLTVINLRNLERHNVSESDTILRVEIVPELWERLLPGTRTELRRITTTTAEYGDGNIDDPHIERRPLTSVNARSWTADIHADAIRLRNRIRQHAMRSVPDLARLTVDAIATSAACTRWPPETPVYECGFAYRLVPVLLHRVITSGYASSTG